MIHTLNFLTLPFVAFSFLALSIWDLEREENDEKESKEVNGRKVTTVFCNNNLSVGNQSTELNADALKLHKGIYLITFLYFLQLTT